MGAASVAVVHHVVEEISREEFERSI